MKKTRKDKIYEVLLDFKKGLHVREIAKELLKRNLEEGISEDKLITKISTSLSSDVKKNRTKSRFRKISNNKGGYKQGFYKLKLVKKPLVGRAIEKIGKGKIEIPNISSLYTGKAGEYAVLSELLFNEFNASLMSVDQGIDIVASKDGDFFHIQVKTANNRNGTFFASISKKQFDRFNNTNTFYIFVLRYSLDSKIESDFIVLRSIDIERFIDLGVIRKAPTLSINMSISKSKIFLNGVEDISLFFNKFDYIKK